MALRNWALVVTMPSFHTKVDSGAMVEAGRMEMEEESQTHVRNVN